MCKEEIVKGTLSWDTSTTCQDADVFTRIVQENKDISAEFLHSSFNEYVKRSNFSSVLKQENTAPVFKKGEKKN